MSKSYVSAMRDIAMDGLSELHRGVRRLHFTDFPDYANVGDSAIALGQMKFWSRVGIEVIDVNSRHTITRSILDVHEPVVINGGGNIGGLYPELDAHRYQLACRLRESTLLIQEPQSIHFVNADERERFARAMGGRRSLRMAVRDYESQTEVRGLGVQPRLVPDSVHVLGTIEAPDSVSDVVVIARTDDEATGPSLAGSRDWLTEPKSFDVFTRNSARAAKVLAPRPRLMGWALQRSNAFWQRRAAARLRRGIAILGSGEVVVTDRLHAMLLGLQIGRRVIAVDNSYGKLSRYAAAWFGDCAPALEFADSLEDAIRIARRL